MPIYEYECKKCGVVDIMQKIAEGAKRKCPECGTLGLKRLISAPAFQLKGSGWYVTDFRDKDKPKDDDKSSKKDDSSSSTETKAESKSDSKSESKGESKSESKTESKSETKSASKSDSSKGAAKKEAS
jgi:putative FmdB family regulatory protein